MRIQNENLRAGRENQALRGRRKKSNDATREATTEREGGRGGWLIIYKRSCRETIPEAIGGG